MYVHASTGKFPDTHALGIGSPAPVLSVSHAHRLPCSLDPCSLDLCLPDWLTGSMLTGSVLTGLLAVAVGSEAQVWYRWRGLASLMLRIGTCGDVMSSRNEQRPLQPSVKTIARLMGCSGTIRSQDTRGFPLGEHGCWHKVGEERGEVIDKFLRETVVVRHTLQSVARVPHPSQALGQGSHCLLDADCELHRMKSSGCELR